MDTGSKPIYHARPTDIYNGRPLQLSLLQHKFELLQHEHGELANIGDWKNDAEIRAKYYPSMLSLAKEMTGALDVMPIYHMYRDGGDGKYGRHGSFYTTFVHGDISPAIEWAGGDPRSGRGQPWEVTAGRHFAIINFWRSVGGTPILNHHLAVLDPRSLQPEDIVPKEDVDDQDKSQHLRLIANDTQKWLYFPNMVSNEVLAFTQYDTREEDSALRQTFHSAFKDPTCPADAPPRQSVELRILCLFGSDEGAHRRRKRFSNQFAPLSNTFQHAQVPFVYHTQLAENLGYHRVKSRL